MSHDHHEHHHHHHSHEVSASQASSKAFVLGIFLNLAYVIAEVIMGFWSHSLALITDAGHNLSDVAGLALSLLAFRMAKIRPSQTFTYGYKKTTILTALLNAVILLVSIGILGYEAVLRLQHPQPVEGGVVAWVSGLGIIINGLSAFLFFKHKDDELNAKGAYLHLLSDMLVSIGVVIAGIIIVYTHWFWLDAVVSLVVLFIILLGTWSLLRDSLRLSLDAVPRHLDVAELEALISKMDIVATVHHMHVWAMSTTENALTAHIIFETGLSFEEKTKAIHNIKHLLAHEGIQHATLEMEEKDAPCAEGNC